MSPEDAKWTSDRRTLGESDWERRSIFVTSPHRLPSLSIKIPQKVVFAPSEILLRCGKVVERATLRETSCREFARALRFARLHASVSPAFDIELTGLERHRTAGTLIGL